MEMDTLHLCSGTMARFEQQREGYGKDDSQHDLEHGDVHRIEENFRRHLYGLYAHVVRCF